ncbi:MAG TPA: hypothetical protein ENG40_01485 [Thermoprotei archaeon]|nr:hypothetical protein [Thermoprotei archaeon]
MIEVRTKYQTSIFGNFKDIMPTSEIIKKLLDLFSDKNFLPSTFQELSPGLEGPQTRIQLVTLNNEWIIHFATHRIDIEQKNPTLAEDKTEYLKSFIQESLEIFKRILEAFRKRSNRLSLVTGGLLKEMSEDKLKRIYILFYKPIDFYKTNPPFEWNSRHVSRIKRAIGEIEEEINIITNIDRLKGGMIKDNQHIPFDRIGIGFDINTAGENDNLRFGFEEISLFYDLCIEIRDNILQDIKERLNER